MSVTYAQIGKSAQRPRTLMQMPSNPRPVPGDIAVRARKLCVRRNGAEVLHQVDLAIPAGQITVIVGPSGAGKTTLIHTLNGLLAPSAGTLDAAGIGKLDCSEALRRHRSQSATVFQDHALIGRLSALENVLLGLADFRHPLSVLPWPGALQLRAVRALDEVGLLQCASSRVDRLSGGERQRVGIARALVRAPRLLLGDEPFASIDAGLARQMGARLRLAAAVHGTTSVLVLHQLDLALELAHHLVALAAGRIVFNGPPARFDALAQARVFGRNARAAVRA